MEIYQFDGTNTLPSIFLDRREMYFEIKGTCFPEDSVAFFKPVFDWLKEFKKDPLPELKVHFGFEYCNTSSSKIIQNLFETFEQLSQNGTSIVVDWVYDPEDEDIFEDGISYAERVSFPVNLIASNKK